MCLEYQLNTWISKSIQIVTAIFPSSGRTEIVSANYEGCFSIYSADGINASLGYVNPRCRCQHFVGFIHNVVTPDIFIVFKLLCQFFPYVTEIVNSASCITNDCILIISAICRHVRLRFLRSLLQFRQPCFRRVPPSGSRCDRNRPCLRLG